MDLQQLTHNALYIFNTCTDVFFSFSAVTLLVR